MTGSLATVEVIVEGAVARITFSRPPSNYFDHVMLGQIADALEEIDRRAELRAVVIASSGRVFCAGAALAADGTDSRQIYDQGLRIMATRKPIVAAIQGAAVGGGLGLALAADFRVAGRNARFAANFVKIGIHPGFGISLTLPRLIGEQNAALLLLTGRRIDAPEARAMGLCDELVEDEHLVERAMRLAGEIAEAAPLAVEATRAMLRRGFIDEVRDRIRAESEEQQRLFTSADYQEGLRAVSERRPGQWRRR